MEGEEKVGDVKLLGVILFSQAFVKIRKFESIYHYFYEVLWSWGTSVVHFIFYFFWKNNDLFHYILLEGTATIILFALEAKYVILVIIIYKLLKLKKLEQKVKTNKFILFLFQNIFLLFYLTSFISWNTRHEMSMELLTW